MKAILALSVIGVLVALATADSFTHNLENALNQIALPCLRGLNSELDHLPTPHLAPSPSAGFASKVIIEASRPDGIGAP